MEQICTGLLNDQNKQTVVPFLVLSANTTEAEKNHIPRKQLRYIRRIEQFFQKYSQ